MTEELNAMAVSGENPRPSPHAGPILLMPFSFPESAQTHAGKVRSEKLQNESSPNCSEFQSRILLRNVPQSLEEFSFIVSWLAETTENSPKLHATFQCQIHRQIRKINPQKFSGEQANLQFPNAVALNGGRTQKHANVRRAAQISTKEHKRESAKIRKKSANRGVVDVWVRDVWDYQAKPGSSVSYLLFLHFLGKIAVQKMSGKTPGSPRHPSSRHPRPSEQKGRRRKQKSAST